jgi:hypothetical protein
VRIFGWTIAAALVAGVGMYALLAAVNGEVLTWTRTVTVCRQPATVDYGEGIYSVEAHIPTARLSLQSPPVEAVVGRGGGYGVFVTLNSDDDDSLKVTCRWSPEAVTIVEPSGISHSVPTSQFTGGR